VYVGPPRWVGFGTPEHLTGDGRHLTNPDEEEAQQVDDGVVFGPFEVDVRSVSGGVPDMQHQGGQRVGHGCTLEGQDPVSIVHDEAVHVEPGGELRGIGDGDLDEDEVLIFGEVVVLEYLTPFFLILGLVTLVGLVGDEPDGAGGALIDELPGSGVELDVEDS
jgi:hypothetical protein